MTMRDRSGRPLAGMDLPLTPSERRTGVRFVRLVRFMESVMKNREAIGEPGGRGLGRYVAGVTGTEAADCSLAAVLPTPINLI